MKGLIKEGLMFFLAMNFIGMATAIGVMIFLGKLDMVKLKDMRKIALGEGSVIEIERLVELKQIEKDHQVKLGEELKVSKQDGLQSSKQYDNRLVSLKKREDEIKMISKDLKIEKEDVIGKLNEVRKIQLDITKRQADLEKRIKEDQDRSKDVRLKAVLKRYSSMEPISVARSLINSSLDPQLDIPIAPKMETPKDGVAPKPTSTSDDPRVERAAFYLKEMKVGRAAEIMETMGPIWTHALQSRMERSPVADAKK